MNLKQRDLIKDPTIWLVKLGVKWSAVFNYPLFMKKKEEEEEGELHSPQFPYV